MAQMESKAFRARKLIHKLNSDFQEGKPCPPMLERLLLFYRWCESGLAIIRSREATLIPLCLNDVQCIVLATAMSQAARGQPVRLVILKHRKPGVSTMVQALFFFFCAHYGNQIGNMLAHQAASTSEIFQISKLMAEHYPYTALGVGQNQISFDGGSRFICHTAGGESFGAGGTPNLLHLSEVALWKQNKHETEYASTQAVPFDPCTVIIYESTARGRDLFYERFEAAHDPSSAYEPLFFPWYMNDWATSPADADVSINDEEQWLVQSAHDNGVRITPGHIAWRRMKLAELGEITFRQEYPSTAEEAVRGTRSLVVPHLDSCIIEDVPYVYAGMEYFTNRVGGIDFGYNDDTVIISAVRFGQVIFVIDVAVFAQSLSTDQASAIMVGHRYFCDPSALAARKELEKLRPDATFMAAPIMAKPQDSEASWQRVRAMILAGNLKIVRSCAGRLLRESESLIYNERTGFPDKGRSEACGHYDALDALRYLVNGVAGCDIRPLNVKHTRGFSLRKDLMI